MLNLHTGVMGSGKSAHLISRYENAILTLPMVFSTEKDCIISARNGKHICANSMSNFESRCWKGTRDKLILIDEAQWMTDEQILLANTLSYHNDVHLFGLLRDYRGEMYPAMAKVIGCLDSGYDWHVIRGECMVEGCTNQAQYHNKLDDKGLKESFQSCCLKHWKHKGGK